MGGSGASAASDATGAVFPRLVFQRLACLSGRGVDSRLVLGFGRRRRCGDGALEERIMRHERRLSAQSLGDERVGIGDAKHHERPPKTIDVRRLPGLSRDEILGDDPCLGGLVGGEVGVGQLLLGIVHGLLEPTVDADFHQLEQRRNLARHARGELLQTGRRLLEFLLRHSRVDGGIDAQERRLRTGPDKRPPEVRHDGAARGIGDEQSAEHAFGAGQLTRPQLDFYQGQQQRRVVAGAVLVEEFTGAGKVALIERRLGQRGAGLAFERIDADKFLQRVNRLRRPPLLEKVVVQSLEALAGLFFLAHLLERPRRGEPGLEVSRVDGPEPDDDFGRASAITLGAAARGDGVEVRLGVGEQTLPGGDVGELNLGGFVLRLELEDLLVERRGLRIEALVDEVLGNARVLPDGLLWLAGARVELAEGVGGAPIAGKLVDDAEVLGDRRLEATLSQQLLRFF